jgi:hypothetical protein
VAMAEVTDHHRRDLRLSMAGPAAPGLVPAAPGVPGVARASSNPTSRSIGRDCWCELAVLFAGVCPAEGPSSNGERGELGESG